METLTRKERISVVLALVLAQQPTSVSWPPTVSYLRLSLSKGLSLHILREPRAAWVSSWWDMLPEQGQVVWWGGILEH